jgi:hypothetical protein
MTIDLLGVYEAKINHNNVRLVRQVDSVIVGDLYINEDYKGRVPFYHTLRRIIELEDKAYPVYTRGEIFETRSRAVKVS